MISVCSDEYKRIVSKLFPEGLDYILPNLIYIFEKEFKAKQIEMDDIPKYIKNCREYPHYFKTIEDYSGDSILSIKENLIFVSDAISDNQYREADSKLYNLVILSIEGDEVINYYCNTQGGMGDLMMYAANKFYEASNQKPEKKQSKTVAS